MADTIRELLDQSRTAHQEYRANVTRRIAQAQSTVIVRGDAERAGAALWRACRLRVEAHALDPQQTDPAWQDEANSHPHDELLDFYSDQLRR